MPANAGYYRLMPTPWTNWTPKNKCRADRTVISLTQTRLSLNSTFIRAVCLPSIPVLANSAESKAVNTTWTEELGYVSYDTIVSIVRIRENDCTSYLKPCYSPQPQSGVNAERKNQQSAP